MAASLAPAYSQKYLSSPSCGATQQSACEFHLSRLGPVVAADCQRDAARDDFSSVIQLHVYVAGFRLPTASPALMDACRCHCGKQHHNHASPLHPLSHHSPILLSQFGVDTHARAATPDRGGRPSPEHRAARPAGTNHSVRHHRPLRGYLSQDPFFPSATAHLLAAPTAPVTQMAAGPRPGGVLADGR